MTTPLSSLPFDARPLVEAVDKDDVRAHMQQLRATGRVPKTSTVPAVVVAAVIGVVFLIMFANIAVGILGSFWQLARDGGGGSPAGILFAVFPVFFLVVIVGLVVVVAAKLFRGASGERWYRLDRFAQANGMTWHAESPAPPLPGMIFGLGHGRRATDVLRGTRPRFVEFANYRYTTGSGKNQTTHQWGYVAVKLSTPLPHIVLDALGNNALFGSNLPASFDKEQRLSLEGDFDRYFALYCPRGYERDALYLFTPDIMARFIDNAAALDVEIVDDWLFLYAKRDFATLDPATWAWLFAAVAALLDKFDQWERWRDERLAGVAVETPVPPAVAASASSAAALPFAAPTAALRPPPGVAPQGRRLTRRVPWGTIAVFAGFAVFWLLVQSGFFGGILSALFSR